jgi:hypothetical protein
MPPSLPLYIFIAYGEIAAARDALERVKRMLGPRAQGATVQPMLWRFDQLNRASWRETALHDALRAHAIVLAMGSLPALNPATDAWLAALTTLSRGAPITCTTFMGDEAWTISLQRSEGRKPVGPAVEMMPPAAVTAVAVRAA